MRPAQRCAIALGALVTALVSLAALAMSSVPGAAGGSAGSEIFVTTSLRSGRADHSIFFGEPGDVLSAGDFTGDGADGFASRVGSVITMVGANGAPQGVATYGKPTDTVFLTGDWNGNRIDGFAIVRGNVVYQRHTPTSGRAHNVFAFGRVGDTYLSGDFDGDGVDTVAVRRNNRILGRNSNTTGTADFAFAYGRPSDTIVFGDFDDDGIDTPAARRGNVVFIRNSNRTGRADKTTSIGRAGDLLLAGDFNGTSTSGASIEAAARSADTFAVRRITPATIEITIATDPTGGTGFSFAEDITSTGTFTRRDGTTKTFANVPPGTYTVVADDPSPDFDLTGLTCVDPDRETTTRLHTRKVKIDADAGETVTCTFTNTERGTIEIVKATDPTGGTGFGFSETVTGRKFTLNDGQTETFSNVLPGSYTVTEDDPAPAFDLTDITCVDPDGGSSDTGLTATIDVDPGETITCTFSNTERGLITVMASSNPVGAPAFAFTGDLGSFEVGAGGVREFRVRPGSYKIAEEHPFFTSDGLVLLDVSCTDSDASGADSTVALGARTATIRLDPHERVVCRFTNGPPNIMLLISDDQGYTDYGFMGNDLVLTPNLDRLASEGLVFTHGFTSSPLCSPSHVSMITGHEWLQFTGRRKVEFPDSPGVTAISGMEPIAAMLADAGYVSYQAGKWWAGPPADSGFTTSGPGRHQFGRESIASLFDFLDEHRGEPSYTYFAPALPHTPWDAPREIYDRYDGVPISNATRLFYSNITRFDDRVGEVLYYLDKHDLRQSTLLMFTADNGWQQGPLDPFMKLGGEHGKLSPYELGFRTPIMFSLPGVIDPGTNTDLVAMADLYPTTLSFAGAERPGGRIGLDLKPIVAESGEVARDAIIGMTPVIRIPGSGESTSQRVFYYRDDKWRYIWWQATGHEELYEIAIDPYETNDIVSDHPDLAAAFRAQIDVWISSLAGPPQGFANPLEPPCLTQEDI